MELRSSLGRARGLGSAKEGVGHWWMQRVTAIALVPLGIWFVFSVAALSGVDYAGFQAWVSELGNATLLVVLVIALFYHAALGIQVVIEDYVSGEGTKIISLLIAKFALFLMAVSCILAVARVALMA